MARAVEATVLKGVDGRGAGDAAIDALGKVNEAVGADVGADGVFVVAVAPVIPSKRAAERCCNTKKTRNPTTMEIRIRFILVFFL